jgi:hypothetical protein
MPNPLEDFPAEIKRKLLSSSPANPSASSSASVKQHDVILLSVSSIYLQVGVK